MLNLFNNKYAFLKKQPKYEFIITIMISLLLFILLNYINTKEIYNHYKTKGLVSCSNSVDTSCTIKTALPTNINFDLITLNNNYLDYEILSKELIVDEQNYQTFYELTLSTNTSLTNQEIVDLNFYYNKQRIITKIKEKMF